MLRSLRANALDNGTLYLLVAFVIVFTTLAAYLAYLSRRLRAAQQSLEADAGSAAGEETAGR